MNKIYVIMGIDKKTDKVWPVTAFYSEDSADLYSCKSEDYYVAELIIEDSNGTK